MKFQAMWYVQPAYAQSNSFTVMLLTEHHLEFLSLKGSSESTSVKMTHCWKSHVTTHLLKRAKS